GQYGVPGAVLRLAASLPGVVLRNPGNARLRPWNAVPGARARARRVGVWTLALGGASVASSSPGPSRPTVRASRCAPFGFAQRAPGAGPRPLGHLPAGGDPRGSAGVALRARTKATRPARPCQDQPRAGTRAPAPRCPRPALVRGAGTARVVRRG